MQYPVQTCYIIYVEKWCEYTAVMLSLFAVCGHCAVIVSGGYACVAWSTGAAVVTLVKATPTVNDSMATGNSHVGMPAASPKNLLFRPRLSTTLPPTLSTPL